jgi:3-phosphoshikimate 1-carboxyvinyltransferase
LIAPYIKDGITIELSGEIVSQPYIELTLEIMKQFGATYEKHDRRITVAEKEYDLEHFQIEGDWSAVSYFVSLCIATEGKLKLRLHPLDSESSQADKQILEIAKKFGLKYKFENNSLIISYDQPKDFSSPIKVDFINCPDIAQTVMVIAAISGTPLLMKGLKTLFIKETNRVDAMTKELSKVGISIRRTHKNNNPRKDYYLLKGKIETSNDPVRFKTYNDHRMAMSLSAIATIRPIQLDDADVVKKSYPDYWNVLCSLGFQVLNLK